MKKLYCVLILGLSLTALQFSLLIPNSLGFYFDLESFSTNKSLYLVNETMEITGTWTLGLQPQDTGYIWYEICNSNGTKLNQSSNFDEQGINIINTYSVPLVNLNLKPTCDLILLFIYLHFFSQDTQTGYIQETTNMTSIRVGFFNLSTAIMFQNDTPTRFDDSLNLSLSILEKDLTNLPVKGITGEFWIENASDTRFFFSMFVTDDSGKFNFQANTTDMWPGIYYIRVQIDTSFIFNIVNYSDPFYVFPGDLIAVVNLDRSLVPISIPKENLTESNHLCIQLFHKSYPFSPPDFQLNWILFQKTGTFCNLGNSTYYTQIGPITQLGQFVLTVKGTSQLYDNFSLNTTIEFIRRELNVTAVFDIKNLTATFQFFDKETGCPISLPSIGKVKAYQVNSPNTPIPMGLETSEDFLKINPLPIPKNATEIKIMIVVEENDNYSFYSEIFTSILPSETGNSYQDSTSQDSNSQNPVSSSKSEISFFIIGCASVGIASCLLYVRMRNKIGVKLKTIKFEL